MVGRRNFLKAAGGGLTGALVSGCVPVYVENGGEQGAEEINPNNFREPSDFPSRSEVSSVISQLRSRIEQTGMDDYPLFLSRERDPPYIAQRYEIVDGLQLVPAQGPLALGSFEWYDQTSDLHIKTDYNQFLGGSSSQQGFSSLGEIIRGERNAYSLDGYIGDILTVYSLMKAVTYSPNGNCGVTAAVIFDGAKFNEEGVDVAYVNYCTAPLSDTGCDSYATAGVFVLVQEGYGELYKTKQVTQGRVFDFSRLLTGFKEPTEAQLATFLGRIKN